MCIRDRDLSLCLLPLQNPSTIHSVLGFTYWRSSEAGEVLPSLQFSKFGFCNFFVMPEDFFFGQ
eukprot:4249165-Prorocentrum_lima.AAC.1